MTIKPKLRLVGNPLPRRNRKENLLKRIAAGIPDQQQLDIVLAQQPPSIRNEWLATLRPYLRFTPLEI